MSEMPAGEAPVRREGLAAMTPERTRILVVNGNPTARRKTVNTLTRAGYEVIQTSSCGIDWQEIAQQRPDLILWEEPLDALREEECRRAAPGSERRTSHVVLIVERGHAVIGPDHRLPAGVGSVLHRPFSEMALIEHVESVASIERHEVAVAAGTQDLVEARRVALSMMQDAEAERQKAEDARAQLEASTRSLRLLQRAIETSPVVVVIADREGFIEYVNPHVTTVTGYAVEELVGNHTRVFKSGHHTPEFYADLWATLGAGRRWHGEFCNRRKDGSLFWESASITPVSDRTGEATHYVAVKEDVTRQRSIMLQLEEARQTADAANKAKSDFLASMSHELRTPLTAIIGFSQVLQDETFGALNPKQGRYVNNVVGAGEHLLSLINDILDLAKVESGRTELEISTIRIRTLLDDSVALVREEALQKALTLHIQAPDDLLVRADERRLKQVLLNLVSNALKFTPAHGDIFVSAARVGDEVQVSVRDTGDGIELADQVRLFERFEQLHTGYDRTHGGTGLGLALCRRLVNLHGGRIWVESPGRGAGSTFHFTIAPQGTVESPLERAVLADEERG
jgi:PAS domain S-box-containing protein